MGEEPQQQPAAMDPLADEKAGKVGYFRLQRLRIDIYICWLDRSLVEYPPEMLVAEI
jgi:hypothetical protein